MHYMFGMKLERTPTEEEDVYFRGFPSAYLYDEWYENIGMGK